MTTSAPEALPYRVVRSRKRVRTVGAQLRDGVVVVSIPSWMSAAEEAHWVQVMSERFSRRVQRCAVDLVERAKVLAARHRLPVPDTIRWVDDMTTRWGSCTPATSTIRISDRLAAFPSWVIDYVVVHEMAHLAHPDHSAEFWAMVHRYPKAERAIGYLIAKADGRSEGLDEAPAGTAEPDCDAGGQGDSDHDDDQGQQQLSLI